MFYLAPKDGYIYLCWVCLIKQGVHMLICISIHADTGTLCFRPIILKRVNSSELVVQTIVYLVEGRQMLQEYQANTNKLAFDIR